MSQVIQKVAKKSEKVKVNDKANKRKTTINGGKRKVDPEKLAMKKYRQSLRKHDWDDSDAGFYRWIAIEANHEISPDSAYFKEFGAVWSGKAENYHEKMDIEEWEKKRAFYRNLCVYGKYF